ncbi:MAG TPA: hypothetical protein VN428_11870 [Bryobacteraceae bacterium]|nr:hypothetical protein [Bryobacteraceae bacterium]
MNRLAIILAACAAIACAEPVPGDYFREYTYAHRMGIVDPGAKHPTAVKRMPAVILPDRVIEVPGLGKPLKAEVSIAYWGGHLGTSEQQFRINENAWINVPQPAGTERPAQCYHRTLLRATVEVPIDQLQSGRNAFQFKAGPQTPCYSFNWGFYWVYSFTLRLYYQAPAEAPGRMIAPVDGNEIGDGTRFIAAAHHPERPIVNVDFVGKYEDFNWEGDGVWRQWHYIRERGRLAKHIGTAGATPWAVTWDSQWVPDQDEPVEVAAWITDLDGNTYVTPSVKVKLARKGRSVRMYKPGNVPGAFGVRVGTRKECKFEVDNPLETARAARLVLHTWSAAHGEELGINGRKLTDRVGLVHNYSFDTVPVPVSLLKHGTNTFYIFSTTKEHAAEVNWPGPALLVEYGAAAAKAVSDWVEPKLDGRTLVTVQAAGHERIDAIAEAQLSIVKKPRSLRVVDAETGSDVPFQFDAPRSLTILMKGVTPPGFARRFHVYFGQAALAARNDLLVRVSSDVDYEGQKSIRITTPAATYTYHKEGAGFASIADAQGNEWIGYKPGGKAAGEYRGIPNAGEFAHPGYTGKTGSVTRIIAQGPLKVTLESVRADGRQAARWDVFPSHARMTMLKSDKPYWFLYEGTPGGKLDVERGFQVTSDGTHRSLAERWSGDMPGAEWLYFGAPEAKQVLYVVNHQDDTAPDQYWPMDGSMTVFGFGREYTCCGRYLESAPARFTIGFAPNAGFNAVARVIESSWRDMQVEVGPVEKRR